MFYVAAFVSLLDFCYCQENAAIFSLAVLENCIQSLSPVLCAILNAPKQVPVFLIFSMLQIVIQTPVVNNKGFLSVKIHVSDSLYCTKSIDYESTVFLDLVAWWTKLTNLKRLKKGGVKQKFSKKLDTVHD